MSVSGTNGGAPGGVLRAGLGAYSQAPGPDQGQGANPNQAVVDLTTPAGRIVENEARAARNEERRARREVEELGVEDDEPMLELLPPQQEQQPVPQPPQAGREGGNELGAHQAGAQAPGFGAPGLGAVQTAPVPGPVAPDASSAAAQAFLVAMSQTGEDKENAMELLRMMFGEKGKGVAAPKKRAKLTESAVAVAGQASYRRHRVDHRLIDLIELGFHLPLTLCTNDAIEAVRLQPELLVVRTLHDADRQKVAVVDVHSGWQDEYSLGSEDWRDAWTNYLQILPEILEDEAVDRFRRHHDFLVKQPNFKQRFPAILRFDIGVRRDYFWGKQCVPFFPESPEHAAAFAQEQNDWSLNLATKTASGSQAQAGQGGKNRFQPYPKPQGGGEADGAAAGGAQAGGAPKPFREGRMAQPGGPLCLICGTSGHRANVCTRTRLPNNNPVFAISVGGKLLGSASGLELCLPWNAGGLSGASERDRVVTTYRADEFEAELRRSGLWEKYSGLPSQLRYGFAIGDLEPITETFTPENHSGGVEHMDFIMEYVNEQVAAGHMSGPYTQAEVEGILGTPFRSSPLAVVEKPGAPGKWRLIQNCSFKDAHGVSVNDLIDNDDFPTKWGTAAEVADIIANAPPGAQMATLDIDAAFRRIPIRPSHKAYLVIQCEPGAFYIDHVCPFGVKCGCGLQGGVMDPIVDILDVRGWGPNKKWVDDLDNMRFPIGIGDEPGTWIYAHSIQDIFDLGERLGIPWHKTKWSPHGFTGVYAGFAWDLPAKTVSLPEAKRVKYLGRTCDALEMAQGGARRMDLKTVEKLNGTLAHCAFVYPRGRTYLAGLCSFLAAFSSEHVPRYPPKSVISDLRWWKETLERPSARRSLVPRGARCDPDIWVDASSDWGIGIVIGQEWDAWRWGVPYEVWHAESRDIGWAEMVAIELVLRCLEERRWENADVLIRSDNEGVIKAFRRGRSRNYQVNLSIRRTEMLCVDKNIAIYPEYVNTKVNRADPVSRGIPDASLIRFKSTFELPLELQPFLAHNSLTSLIPPSASVRLFQIILGSLETGTKKNYGAGLLRFTQFCDRLGIPESSRMPAPEPLIAAFVADFAGSVRHDTISGWLSGLAVWHSINGAEWHGGKMLAFTKKGAKKVEPPPLPKRPPVTLEHVHALFTGLRLDDTFDAAVFAVACVAFWGCRRLGELTIPSRGGFDRRKHIIAAEEVRVRTLPSGVKYAVFHIPWTKTTKSDGADIILTQNSDPTDPVTALLNHRVLNQTLTAPVTTEASSMTTTLALTATEAATLALATTALATTEAATEPTAFTVATPEPTTFSIATAVVVVPATLSITTVATTLTITTAESTARTSTFTAAEATAESAPLASPGSTPATATASVLSVMVCETVVINEGTVPICVRGSRN
ncbi:hypothetical protein VTO73DRAFT_4905 [Trametes versicolor]